MFIQVAAADISVGLQSVKISGREIDDVNVKQELIKTTARMRKKRHEWYAFSYERFFLFLYPLVTSLKLSNMIKDELPFYSSLSFSRHTKKKKRRFKEEATNEHVLYLNNGCISLKFPHVVTAL